MICQIFQPTKTTKAISSYCTNKASYRQVIQRHGPRFIGRCHNATRSEKSLKRGHILILSWSRRYFLNNEFVSFILSYSFIVVLPLSCYLGRQKEEHTQSTEQVPCTLSYPRVSELQNSPTRRRNYTAYVTSLAFNPRIPSKCLLYSYSDRIV